MKRLPWLPLVATAVLISLFFVRNIAIDDGSVDVYTQSEDSYDINDLGEESEFVEQSEAIVDLEDFEEFLHGFGKQVLVSHKEQQLDTTGDGSEEWVVENVEVENGICSIFQQIKKKDVVIWENSFQISSDDLPYYFKEDELYAGKEDEALFYLGLTLSPFVEMLPLNEQFDERSRSLSRLHFYGKDISFAEIYNTSFHQNLIAYEGYYVFDRRPGRFDIYLWQKDENKFVLVNENTHSINFNS